MSVNDGSIQFKKLISDTEEKTASNVHKEIYL